MDEIQKVLVKNGLNWRKADALEVYQYIQKEIDETLDLSPKRILMETEVEKIAHKALNKLFKNGERTIYIQDLSLYGMHSASIEKVSLYTEEMLERTVISLYSKGEEVRVLVIEVFAKMEIVEKIEHPPFDVLGEYLSKEFDEEKKIRMVFDNEFRYKVYKEKFEDFLCEARKEILTSSSIKQVAVELMDILQNMIKGKTKIRAEIYKNNTQKYK